MYKINHLEYFLLYMLYIMSCGNFLYNVFLYENFLTKILHVKEFEFGKDFQMTACDRSIFHGGNFKHSPLEVVCSKAKIHLQ